SGARIVGPLARKVSVSGNHICRVSDGHLNCWIKNGHGTQLDPFPLQFEFRNSNKVVANWDIQSVTTADSIHCWSWTKKEVRSVPALKDAAFFHLNSSLVCGRTLNEDDHCEAIGHNIYYRPHNGNITIDGNDFLDSRECRIQTIQGSVSADGEPSV